MGCQMGGVRGWGEKNEEFGSTDLQLQTDHGDTKYHIENIVNNIVISIYGASSVLEIFGGTLCNVHDGVTALLYTWD